MRKFEFYRLCYSVESIIIKKLPKYDDENASNVVIVNQNISNLIQFCNFRPDSDPICTQLPSQTRPGPIFFLVNPARPEPDLNRAGFGPGRAGFKSGFGSESGFIPNTDKDNKMKI